MGWRGFVLVAALGAAAMFPEASFGATLTLAQPCYGEAMNTYITGSGFPPVTDVVVHVGTDPAAGATVATDQAGNFTFQRPAPLLPSGVRQAPFTIQAVAAGGATASATMLVTRQRVTWSPRPSRPHARVTWHIRGFFGPVVWARYRFEHRWVRFGAAHGPCGTLTVHRPLVPRGWKAHLGIWSIRFDSGPGRTPMLNRLGASFLICNRHLAQMLSDCPRPLGTAG